MGILVFVKVRGWNHPYELGRFSPSELPSLVEELRKNGVYLVKNAVWVPPNSNICGHFVGGEQKQMYYEIIMDCEGFDE